MEEVGTDGSGLCSCKMLETDPAEVIAGSGDTFPLPLALPEDDSSIIPTWVLARLRLLAPPFHQFFMALSLLPLRCLAISAHFLPYFATNFSINSPSSLVMGVLFSEGFKFWWYLSLHCLGVLVFNVLEILTQLEGPKIEMSSINFRSSSGDQGPRLFCPGWVLCTVIACDWCWCCCCCSWGIFWGE